MTPGWVATRSSQARIRGVRSQVEAALGGDVGVGVEGDVGDREAIGDEVLVLGEVALHRVERCVAGHAPGIDVHARRWVGIGDRGPEADDGDRGSCLYCSKNIHCRTWARS